MKTIRTKFEKDFSKEQAERFYDAAVRHENGMYPNRGKDPFKWVLMLVISYQCAEKFRKDHGITIPWRKTDKWIKENAHLESYDGDIDRLALVAGAYNKYMPKKKGKSQSLNP